MDRFQYKEHKLVGKCKTCENDIFKDELVYQHDGNLFCEESCKNTYCDAELGITYGVVNENGEVV